MNPELLTRLAAMDGHELIRARTRCYNRGLHGAISRRRTDLQRTPGQTLEESGLSCVSKTDMAGGWPVGAFHYPVSARTSSQQACYGWSRSVSFGAFSLYQLLLCAQFPVVADKTGGCQWQVTTNTAIRLGKFSSSQPQAARAFREYWRTLSRAVCQTPVGMGPTFSWRAFT